MDNLSLERFGRFRQKVIRLCIVEKKSIYEAAIACGCSSEKIKRVLKKWKMVQKLQKREQQNALSTQK